MVSFPTNQAVLERLSPDAEAVRIDAILPDVLRRYGLAPAASRQEEVRPTPSPTLPVVAWFPFADNHSPAVR